LNVASGTWGLWPGWNGEHGIDLRLVKIKVSKIAPSETGLFFCQEDKKNLSPQKILKLFSSIPIILNRSSSENKFYRKGGMELRVDESNWHDRYC